MDEVRKSTPLASEPSDWQPQCQMGRCAASSEQGHHGGMMPGGGGGKMQERGVEDDNSYSMQTRASINDGGCRHPTADTGLHSRLLSIQQSANIPCDSTKLLKLENVIINNVY